MDDYDASGQWRGVTDNCAWVAFWIVVGVGLWAGVIGVAVASILGGDGGSAG